ncbi:MAG: monofunctional biosynthetic peptidoglycan transglycosylase [Pseudomonadota bacterium]
MSTATKAAKRQKSSGFLRRVLRWVLIIVVLMVAIPIVLVPLYALVPPPASTLMLTHYLTGKSVTRDWVGLSEISDNLPTAVLMSEDGQFCAHHGVDWNAVRDVVESVRDGERARGASTITMQTVKNLYLWPSRSYLRKALEVPLALYADFVWSKRRTMTLYLNIAEWGPGIFGAEAAAQHYFNKPASSLSRREAARLAAVLPNPFVRNAARPGPHTARITRIIEQRMRQAGPYDDCVESG